MLQNSFRIFSAVLFLIAVQRNSISALQTEHNQKVLKLLERSINSLSLKLLDTFVAELHAMSDSERVSLLYGRESDHFFSRIGELQINLFQRNPSPVILKLYSKMMKSVGDSCTACSESMDLRFSEYFASRLTQSLTALDEVDDTSTVVDIAQRACFKEGNSTKIISYIRKHKLTQRLYCKVFMRYDD